MQCNNTILPDIRQRLVDISPTGKERPWAKHKDESIYLAGLYDLQGENKKASRVRSCAEWVEFSKAPDNTLTLRHANFCRVRLCPMCQWRRSLKIYGQTKQIVTAADTQRLADGKKPYGWVMLTLTQKNVDGCDLKNELDIIHKALRDLMRRKRVKDAVIGWQRMTEITHNTEYGGTSFDTFHPHIHLLLCVLPSYFTSRNYIPHAEWVQLWRECCLLDYDPQVEVHRIKGDTSQAIAEVSKYATKPADYLITWDAEFAAETVATLDAATANRRCLAYGGLLKQLKQSLNLDDAENGDLVHTDCEEGATETAEQVADFIRYHWCAGVRTYCRE